MRFPQRDLTNQYISLSYQDVVQQYNTGSVLYVLDGYGNVIYLIPSESIGQYVITSDITSSMSVATASYILNFSGGSGGTTLYTASTYEITSSWAISSSVSKKSDFANTSFTTVIYYGNLDGGTPDYFYGGITPIDAGSP